MASIERLGALLAVSLMASACMGASGGPPAGTTTIDPGIGGATGGVGGAGGVEHPPFDAPSPTLRRLLSRQYVSSVRDLLGDAAAAAAAPPPDSSLNGFDSIGAARLAVGDAAIAQYESSALAVATAAMGDMARIQAYLGCTPAGPHDVVCHKRFIAAFGRMAFRRPLDAEELDQLGFIAHGAAVEYGDFYAGVRYAILGILQSPHFIYQVEVGKPIAASAQGLRYLTGYELATRMSFFLVGTTPSAALLDSAAEGALGTAAGVRAAAEELLVKPEAREALAAFYGELFRLRDLDKTSKDLAAFPQFSPALAQAMWGETRRLIDDVVWDRNTDFRDILTADHTFVDPALAALYGMSPPSGSGFQKVPVAAGQKRGGFFGHASFHALFAHAKATSPTLRGRFVREMMLCQAIPAPPNNVNTTLPSNGAAKTMRERLEEHQKDPACAGCHELMDNIGFGLENYDAIGGFRSLDNGAEIDAKADAIGIGTFEGAAELGALLRDHPDMPTCLIRNLLRASTGHLETDGEEAAIASLAAGLASSGHKLRDLLVEIVASDAFRLVGKLD